MKPFTAHWRKSRLFFQTVKRPPAIPLAYSLASACVPPTPPPTTPLASPDQNGLCLADSRAHW